MTKDLKKKIIYEMNGNGSSLTHISECIATVFNEKHLNK